MDIHLKFWKFGVFWWTNSENLYVSEEKTWVFGYKFKKRESLGDVQKKKKKYRSFCEKAPK